MGFERGDKNQPVRGLAVQSKEIVYSKVKVFITSLVSFSVFICFTRELFLTQNLPSKSQKENEWGFKIAGEQGHSGLPLNGRSVCLLTIMSIHSSGTLEDPCLSS